MNPKKTTKSAPEDEPKLAREGPLKIPLKFDDATKRALKVTPPPEGWAEFERKLKRERNRRG